MSSSPKGALRVSGIERKMDELGRVVIPKEFRRSLKLGKDSPVEITMTDDGAILVRPVGIQGCSICGGMENLRAIKKGAQICRSCLEDIRKLL